MTATSLNSSSLACPPRYGTARTPGRMTLGPKVAETAQILRKPFMPWQRYVTSVSLELMPNGLPAYHTVIVVVMRQQGKTEMALPVMTHRAMATGPDGWNGPQRILYTTQTASEARKKWEDIHVKRLQESPLSGLFDVRLRLNAEAMLWSNGSMWSPGSTTAKTGGTGDTLDLGWIDEAWSRPDDRTELGMRPAMLTRPKRQLWVTSMVPGLTRAKTVDSAYLRQRMQIGRAQVRAGVNRGVAYFEFSAPAGRDPGDPATWYECMPALCPAPVRGVCRCSPHWRHTITEESVAGDFAVMDIVDFCAEYMGWWPQDNKPTWTLVREQTWRGLRDPYSQIVGPHALAIDCDPDRLEWWIGAAGKRSDGDWHVEILEPGGQIPAGTAGGDWVERRALDIIDRNGPCAVVIAPTGPAASLIVPLRNAGVEVLTPNGMDIAGACERLYDATGEGKPPPADETRPTRVWHLGQLELDRAVAGARKLISQTHGTFIWARVGSAVSISALYVVTLAMHGYEVKAPEDYDVLGSVGAYEGECPECGASPPPGRIDIEHDPECPLVD